jgi:D-serine deaminase-like pyridoxal phosphate-dependent protein
MSSAKSSYQGIDTPALLIDKDILEDNIRFMQSKAQALGIALRPHTKTHKMPSIAKMQVAAGAAGIAVAKVGEAEAMAAAGLTDIFIANEIVGEQKLARIRKLGESIDISFGVDSVFAIRQIDKVFAGARNKAHVLVEIETGELRSGVVTTEQFLDLLAALHDSEQIEFRGVFSHEGFTYKAADKAECLRQFVACQERTMSFAALAAQNGFPCLTVSVGATPTAMLATHVKAGITELRPGTYVLMDVAQGNAIGTYDRCAATVLTTIISKPTAERLIGDAGAKALTQQTRSAGICQTEGFGYIKGSAGVFVHAVYDEHTIIYDKVLNRELEIGDKIEIIPNHICPVCNLYDEAYLVSGGAVIDTLSVDCRGKLR